MFKEEVDIYYSISSLLYLDLGKIGDFSRKLGNHFLSKFLDKRKYFLITLWQGKPYKYFIDLTFKACSEWFIPTIIVPLKEHNMFKEQ